MTPTATDQSSNQREHIRLLPDGWRWVRLGEVCEEQTEFRDPRLEPNKVFHYVDITSIDNIGKRIVGAKMVLGKDAPSRARQVIRTGDVIVSTTRPNLNAVALVPPELDNQICSTGFCVLRAKDDLEQSFLFAYVRTKEFVENLSGLVKGALYPAVTDKQVRSQCISLPPPAEQKRIAAILTEQMMAVERARAAAEAQVESAKALPAAYLRAVFNSPEAKQWPRKKLGEVGDIVSGVTLGRQIRNGKTRSVPYLRVANVKDGHLTLSDVYRIEATEAEIEKLELKFGDLLLTEGGDPDKLGRGTFWEEQIPECIHQNHIFRVRFEPNEFDPQFVSAQIGSPYGKAYFLSHAKQSTGIATINQKVLAGFPLMTPSFSDQKRITAGISEQMVAVERTRKALDVQLITINALPAALLRQAFSGKILPEVAHE